MDERQRGRRSVRAVVANPDLALVGRRACPTSQATTFADFMVLAMIMTSRRRPSTLSARWSPPLPGIVTYTDLPLPLPRGLVP